jgi:hypothetical protein
MAAATWWKGDSLPALAPLPGFSAHKVQDISEITAITRLDEIEVRRRLKAGHKPYIGYIQETPVGYGWVAHRTAEIGELQLSFVLPKRSRYLWDFATLPEWRGHGAYPHLLQRILKTEARYAQRIWIVYAPENKSSSSGIHKAGIENIGELSFALQGGLGLAPLQKIIDIERFQATLDLFGVPERPIDQLLPEWNHLETSQVTTVPSRS